jgi:hypothetical protein
VVRRLAMDGIERRTFRSWLVAATGASVLLMCAAAEATQRSSLRSPDGSLVAVVKHLHRAGTDGVGESAIAIRQSAGAVLFRRNYTSDDGEHGFFVGQTEWSADSGYLIYVTQSSGGHQPWHSPTYIWSRTDNAVYAVADCLLPVADPSFSLKPPDVVTLSLNTPRRDGGFAGSLTVSFQLSDLVRACKEQ